MITIILFSSEINQNSRVKGQSIVKGRIVLNEEVTEIVDTTKEIFGIEIQAMSDSVKSIYEVAIQQRKDFKSSVEKLLSVIQDHCSEYSKLESVIQVLKVYRKYFP